MRGATRRGFVLGGVALIGSGLVAPGSARAQGVTPLPPADVVPLDSVVEVATLPPVTAPAWATATPVVRPRLSPESADLAQAKALLHGTAAPGSLAPGTVTDAGRLAEDGPRAPTLGAQFEGLANADQGLSALPPDDNLGVGPSHVFQMVNISGRISTKAGATLSTFSLANFFGLTAGFGESDPRVIYDAISGRWLAVYLEYDDSLGRSSLVFASSLTSDPTGTFCRYRLGNPTQETFLQDYPMFGVTDDKVVLSYNGFSFPTFSFVGSGYYVIRKADLLGVACAGGLTVQRVAPLLGRASPHPMQALGSTSNLVLASHSSTATLRLITVAGVPPAASESVIALPIRSWALQPNAPQPGTGVLLDSGDTRVLSVAWQANSLWVAGGEACVPAGDVTSRACLRLIEVRTDTGTVRQDMTFAGAPGDFFMYPAMRPDASGHLHVVFTHASATTFASVRVTGRLVSDPLNTLQPSVLLRAGGGAQTHSSGRLGDYSGAAVDPSEPSKVWVIGEYIRATGSANWGTYVAQLAFAFSGGIFVATGHVTTAVGPAQIITGPGPGRVAEVRVFDGDGTPRVNFQVYPAGFQGGVRVAACDFDGDGRAEVVSVAGPGGGPHVRVMQFDAAGTFVADLASFFAYDLGFTGGLFVACGDIDGDGNPEIILGVDAGGGPHVRILRFLGGVISVLDEFFAYDAAFRGGIRVAAGNVDAGDRASLVLGAGPGGGPHVRVLKYLVAPGSWQELVSVMVYDIGFRQGIFVAAGDVDGDARAEVVTSADAGGGPHVRVLRYDPAVVGGLAGVSEFMAYDTGFRGGVRVAVGNVLGGAPGEIVTGAGPTGGPHAGIFTPTGVPLGGFFTY